MNAFLSVGVGGVVKRLVLGLSLCLSACALTRTEVQPKAADPIDDTPRAAVSEPQPGECNVQDFPSYSDVPEGAKNLGSVSVERQASDEDTYLALRKAVCEKGGDAMSSLRWLHTIGKKDGPPTDLEATVWLLP